MDQRPVARSFRAILNTNWKVGDCLWDEDFIDVGEAGTTGRLDGAEPCVHQYMTRNLTSIGIHGVFICFQHGILLVCMLLPAMFRKNEIPIAVLLLDKEQRRQRLTRLANKAG